MRWQDVDLEAGRVCIQRALSVVDGVPRLLVTKTANPRTVSIGATAIDVLRAHQCHQQAQRQAAPSWQDRWGLVFTDDAGAPIDPMEVTRAFRALVREAPLPVVRLHDLRHFHAGALLQPGII